MSQKNTESALRLLLGQLGEMTRGGWSVAFNAAGGAPEVTHNGVPYQLTPAGIVVPSDVAQSDQTVILPGHDYTIGQMAAGAGIYIGVWRNIVDCKGRKLNAEFNVFAAPQDTRFLTQINCGYLTTYREDIQRIGAFRGVCGYDGIVLETDTEIYRAIANEDYERGAKWHMPAKELVVGRRVRGKGVQRDNLYAHRDEGALQGTFTDKGAPESYKPHYWTASHCPEAPWLAHVVDFSDPEEDSWLATGNWRLSSRAIRLQYRGPANPEWLLAA